MKDELASLRQAISGEVETLVPDCECLSCYYNQHKADPQFAAFIDRLMKAVQFQPNTRALDERVRELRLLANAYYEARNAYNSEYDKDRFNPADQQRVKDECRLRTAKGIAEGAIIKAVLNLNPELKEKLKESQ